MLRRPYHTPRALTEYAKSLAGTTWSRDSIYVDGVSSGFLPPVERIESVAINRDPFSVQYAEENVNRIEITTTAPERRFRVNFGGTALATGGQSLLRPGLRSSSGSMELSLTGPIPKTPLTFIASGSHSRRDEERATHKLTPNGKLDAPFVSGAAAADDRSALSLGSYFSRSENLKINFHLITFRSSSQNADVGGIILPEASGSGSSSQTEGRLTFERSFPGFVHRGGVVIHQTAYRSLANNKTLGIRVVGTFNSGGAETEETRVDRRNWIAHNLIQYSRGKIEWVGGATVSYSGNTELEVPNPRGVLQFDSLLSYENALAGLQGGTWFITSRPSRVYYRSFNTAPFIEGLLLQHPNLALRAGLRVEHLTSAGFSVAPRLGTVFQHRGFVIRLAAGIFVHTWPPEMFIHARKNDGSQTQHFIVHDAAFELGGRPPSGPEKTVLMVTDPDLKRPRHLMARTSVERAIGNFRAGIEYAWTRGTHLVGARRLPNRAGWTDRIESARSLRSQQFHAKLGFRARSHTITAHYEWFRSHDDSDGPLAYAANHANLRSDWGRTAGLPRHHASIVGDFNLPPALALSVVATLRSSSPYDITSGLDIFRNGLHNDRGGRVRNSGDGPAYKSVSLFASHTFKIPLRLPKREDGIALRLGLEAQNLLNNKNYLELGSVVSSPFFGKPFGTFPGRSLRFWLNFRF